MKKKKEVGKVQLGTPKQQRWNKIQKAMEIALENMELERMQLQAVLDRANLEMKKAKSFKIYN